MKTYSFKNISSKLFGNGSGYEKLSARERWVLFAGLLFLIIIVCYHFMVSPFFVAQKRLNDSILRKKNELVQINQLKKEYLEIKKGEGGLKEMLSKRFDSFSLFTFLDGQAEKAQIKDNIKYMKPSIIENEGDLTESIVEMKLQGVSLEGIVGFLRLTESLEYVVSIERLTIQSSAKDKSGLDVLIRFVTLEEGS